MNSLIVSWRVRLPSLRDSVGNSSLSSHLPSCVRSAVWCCMGTSGTLHCCSVSPSPGSLLTGGHRGSPEGLERSLCLLPVWALALQRLFPSSNAPIFPDPSFLIPLWDISTRQLSGSLFFSLESNKPSNLPSCRDTSWASLMRNDSAQKCFEFQMFFPIVEYFHIHENPWRIWPKFKHKIYLCIICTCVCVCVYHFTHF